MFANAVERTCLLEEALERAQAEIEELKAKLAEHEGPPGDA